VLWSGLPGLFWSGLVFGVRCDLFSQNPNLAGTVGARGVSCVIDQDLIVIKRASSGRIRKNE